jgi:predicted transcriptional regulator
MSDEGSAKTESRTALAAHIVCAYLSNNQLSAAALPDLIAAVHNTIAGLGKAAPPSEKPVPAVPIRRSVTPAYLISLEDGRRYKSLKRHLGTLGLTPQEYRTKWGLPPDYPMVAAEYATRRSELARAAGLGRRRRTANDDEPVSRRTPASQEATPDAAA